MKNAMKKLLSLTLAVMLLLSVAPFQAFAATNAYGEMVFSEEFEAPATNNNTSTSQTAEEPKPVVDNDGGVSTFALPSDDYVIGKTVVNIYFNVDGSVMKTVAKKVGDDFPGLPSGKDALAFYAKVNENSNGKAFKCWSFEEDGAAISASGLKVGGSDHLTEDDHQDSKGNPVSPDAKGNLVGKMEVYAVFEDVVSTTNVKLDPKSGKFAPGDSDTIAVSLNVDYPVADFPTPTRSGYVFDGWYVKEDASHSERCLVDAEGNPGADLTVLSTSARPYAKWKKTGMTVSVKWYDFDNGDWTAFTVNGAAKYDGMAVPADSKLSASTGSFPTDSEINWLKSELPDGYTLKGWKFLETGKEFKAGSSAITSANANSSNEVVIVPKLQRSVWLIAQHPTKNTLAKQSITVEIGSRIGELPAPASWAEDSDETDGYTFTQWVADDTVISTREDLKNTSKHPVYYPSLNSNDDHSSRYEYHFDAQWEVAKVVQLYFHVDGKTSTYAKKVSCYDIPASGSFNMHSLNLYKYFPDYSKYDDGVDVAYGWYTDAQWKNYCTGKPAATVCDELWNVSDTKDLQELHIMLIDKGTDSNKYNNNNKTADRTNPKTGDIIMAAVAILVVSGAALAGIYYLTKKKRGTK
jgi:repeat protein